MEAHVLLDAIGNPRRGRHSVKRLADVVQVIFRAARGGVRRRRGLNAASHFSWSGGIEFIRRAESLMSGEIRQRKDYMEVIIEGAGILGIGRYS